MPEPTRESSGDTTLYYAAEPLKVVLLTLATFGIYQMYWLFVQWRAVRIETRERLSPFWRAVFDIFFAHRLFAHIRNDVAAADVKTTLSTGALIVIFIVSGLIGRITLRMETGWLWLGSFASVVPLAILQDEINQYLARRRAKRLRQSGFGAGAIALLFLGAILWAAVVYNAFAGVDVGAGR